MAFSLGSISGTLNLDNSSYRRSIIESEALNRIFGSSFTAFITNPVLGGIDVMQKLGGAMKNRAIDVLSFAETMQRLSDATGLTTDTLQALRAQMDLAIGQGESADRAVRAFTQRLGDAAKGNEQLRVILQGLVGDLQKFESVEDVFRGVVRSLALLEDAEERAFLASRLFGEEAGPILIQALRDYGGEMDALIERMRVYGQVHSRDVIDKAAALNTLLGQLRQAFDGVADTTVINFLAGLVDITGTSDEKLRELLARIQSDLPTAAAEAGRRIGELIGDFDRLLERIENGVDSLGRFKDALLSVPNFGNIEGVESSGSFLGYGTLTVAPREGDVKLTAQQRRALTLQQLRDIYPVGDDLEDLAERLRAMLRGGQ